MARKAIPRAAIDLLVGRYSCGESVATVRAYVETRCAAQAWATPARVKACGDYAAKVHASNQKMYCDVVRGRIGRGR